MRSIRQSRGRLAFELFCALIVAASCVGAWIQTGASALLPVAGVAFLYGIVHLFDLVRRDPDRADDSKPTDVAADRHPSVELPKQSVVPQTVAGQLEMVETALSESSFVEPASPQDSKAGRAKAPRKGGGKRASKQMESETVEIAQPEEPEVIAPEPIEEADFIVPAAFEEEYHAPLHPLFETDSLPRPQRAVFGRKSG